MILGLIIAASVYAGGVLATLMFAVIGEVFGVESDKGGSAFTIAFMWPAVPILALLETNEDAP